MKFNINIKLHTNMTLHLFHSACSKLINSSLPRTLCSPHIIAINIQLQKLKGPNCWFVCSNLTPTTSLTIPQWKKAKKLYCLLQILQCLNETHKFHVCHLSDENLFPFGLSEGDLTVPRFRDGSSPRIDLCTPIPFFGTTEVALYVSSLHLFMYKVG